MSALGKLIGKLHPQLSLFLISSFMMKKIEDSLRTQLISNWSKGLFFLVIIVELFVENDSIIHYNIASGRTAQSNSVYVGVLKIPIVHADCVS